MTLTIFVGAVISSLTTAAALGGDQNGVRTLAGTNVSTVSYYSSAHAFYLADMYIYRLSPIVS